MPQFVRVKDPVSGHEYSTTTDHAESAALEVLKGRDAVDGFGRILPVKLNTDKAGQPAKESGK